MVPGNGPRCKSRKWERCHNPEDLDLNLCNHEISNLTSNYAVCQELYVPFCYFQTVTRTDRIPGIPAMSCSPKPGDIFQYQVLQSVIVLML